MSPETMAGLFRVESEIGLHLADNGWALVAVDSSGETAQRPVIIHTAGVYRKSRGRVPDLIALFPQDADLGVAEMIVDMAVKMRLGEPDLDLGMKEVPPEGARVLREQIMTRIPVLRLVNMIGDIAQMKTGLEDEPDLAAPGGAERWVAQYTSAGEA